MSIKSSQALLAALALIAGPAFAQDAPSPAVPATEAPSQTVPAAETPATPAQVTEAPAETPSEAPAAPQATAPAEPAPGTAAPATGTAAPASGTAAQTPAQDTGPDPEGPGSYYAKSEHGDWTIRCIRAGQGKDPCEMYKLLTDEDDNAVAELTLVPLSNGNVAAGATLVAPLETDLIEGLGFQVDSGETRGYPFSFCAPVGCISRLGFTQAELAGMKSGGTANVQLLPFGGDPANPVKLSMSLAGFTAAFDELAAYAALPASEAPASEAPADAAPAEETPAE